GRESVVVPVSVVEAEAPRRFVFRWVQPDGQPATPENSFLVTFELVPAGDGTLLRLTEAGLREVGWEAAQLEPDDPDPCPPRRRRGVGWRPAASGGVRGPCGASMTAAIDDELWAALGDPARRRLLDLLLVEGSGTATSLSGAMPVTRQAVAKHLGVLERAELV